MVPQAHANEGRHFRSAAAAFALSLPHWQDYWDFKQPGSQLSSAPTPGRPEASPD